MTDIPEQTLNMVRNQYLALYKALLYNREALCHAQGTTYTNYVELTQKTSADLSDEEVELTCTISLELHVTEETIISLGIIFTKMFPTEHLATLASK